MKKAKGKNKDEKDEIQVMKKRKGKTSQSPPPAPPPEETKQPEVTGQVPATISTSEVVEESVVGYLATAQKILSLAKSLVISDQKSLEFAMAGIKKISEIKASVKEREEYLLKPFADQVKRVKAEFVKIYEPLDDADVAIRHTIKGYTVAVAEEQAKQRMAEELARQKLKEERAKQQDVDDMWLTDTGAIDDGIQVEVGIKPTIEVAAPLPEVKKTTRTESGNVTLLDDVEVDIIDSKELLRAYVSLNIPTNIIKEVKFNMSTLTSWIVANNIESLPGCTIKRGHNIRITNK